MVRKAISNDSKQLSILNYEFNNNKVDERYIRTIIENGNELILVDEVENRLTGFLCSQLLKSFCYSFNVLIITELYIDIDYRGKGIAKELIKHLEKIGNKNCVKEIRVETGINNIAGRELYTKMGYEIIDEVVFHKNI
jgi:ribosomal protein S18 acetylase RimI-like enzyme